ncbi:aspartate-semialdehyde dehydrogenase [bacterium]|nr:aspartate-semialdehyde dehydrogenase [bacterium]
MEQRKPNIAVLGATGVVGRHILEIMEELKIPYNSVKLLSSAKSAGAKMTFDGKEYTLEEATPESFDGIDIVLASAGASTSKTFAPEIVKRGGLIIDNSSAFRMDNDVPLVIAGVNDDDLKNHKGIIANPNCSTSQLILALKPLNDLAKIKRMIVSTYQSVSGAGLAAINELKENTKARLEDKDFTPVKFTQEIAFNCVPQIDVFCENGYTKEEMKVTNETRKIMHFPDDMPISCTAVRVPVFVGHSEAIDLEFENPITAEQARDALKGAYGIEVVDDIENKKFPTAIQCAGKDPVYIGRIRKNIAFENGISFWCVGDNLRIGAALNTVRICKKVIEMGLF